MTLIKIFKYISNFQRSATGPKISKLEEEFESFLSHYFGACYDKQISEKWEPVIFEIKLYFFERWSMDTFLGGWSSYYCQNTWNDLTLENEADLKVFDLLLKIDILNDADQSRIVLNLCQNGAFEAVKVRKSS